MPDPTSTNNAISIADEVENVIFEATVTAVEKYSEAQLPFLALPIVKQIFEFIVEKLSGLLKEQLENFVAFTIIDMQEASKNAAYKQSIMSLQIALHGGDADAIAKAKSDFKSTLADLVHWSGS